MIRIRYDAVEKTPGSGIFLNYPGRGGLRRFGDSQDDSQLSENFGLKLIQSKVY